MATLHGNRGAHGKGLLQRRVRAAGRRGLENHPRPVWVRGEGVSEIEQGKSGDTVDGDRAFIEWSAVFDCDADCRAELARTLAGWFETWLESLRDSMAV